MFGFCLRGRVSKLLPFTFQMVYVKHTPPPNYVWVLLMRPHKQTFMFSKSCRDYLHDFFAFNFN